MVVEELTSLWKRSIVARVLVTCSAVVGSCDGAQQKERVYTQAAVSMAAFRAGHTAPNFATAMQLLHASRGVADGCGQLTCDEVLT